MKTQLKPNNETQLFITIKKSFTDKNGNVTILNEKIPVKQDYISLGSIKSPQNENIIKFEWETVRLEKWFKESEGC